MKTFSLMRKLIVVALVAMGQWAVAEGAVAQTVVEYLHTDALGSPVAVTNQAGTVIERNDYEPYGAMIGKPNYQGIGYTGHVQDAATGLTYMQQRYYDPQVGVFLSVDPVTAYGNAVKQFNRYRYANGNPYMFTDPDGRQSTCNSNPENAAICAEIAATGNVSGTVGGGAGAGGTGKSLLGGLLTALGLHGLIQRADTPESAAEKIKEGTSPSDGPKAGNGDVHPGGEEAANDAWDSIEGVGETRRYEGRNGRVTEVKELEGGGVADKHTSTKSDHQGATTIKIRDSENKVIQTTRYPDKK